MSTLALEKMEQLGGPGLPAETSLAVGGRSIARSNCVKINRRATFLELLLAGNQLKMRVLLNKTKNSLSLC